MKFTGKVVVSTLFGQLVPFIIVGCGAQTLPLVAYPRSFDGSEHPTGEAGAILLRTTVANYGPGDSMRVGPNVRGISNTVAVDTTPGTPNPNELRRNDMLWAWGQFVDHDISITPGEGAAISLTSPDCDTDTLCTIFFTRSVHEQVKGVRQHINEITAFLDASMIYGSSQERADALRADSLGRLRTSNSGSLLPMNDAEVGFIENENQFNRPPEELFAAGDVRANEQIGLTALHTLFVREHNRIAGRIRKRRPGSSDEDVYQAARKLVTAEIQKITYNEFLPALLGSGAEASTITPANYRGYEANTEPGVATEFSTVAFRVGHTMLPSSLLLIDSLNGYSSQETVPLIDAFFNPDLIVADPSVVDRVLIGLCVQKAQEVDLQIVEEVRTLLFGAPLAGIGNDLASLNIQRGRDHGIPVYNKLRRKLGLTRKRNFSAINPSNIPMTRTLKTAYGKVRDVDAWIGGLAEEKITADSMVGETFATIIIDQFDRLMHGDEFFYLNDPELDDFSDVLDLDSVKLASVMRRNIRGSGINPNRNVFTD